jgi:hypothetical protein
MEAAGAAFNQISIAGLSGWRTGRIFPGGQCGDGSAQKKRRGGKIIYFAIMPLARA